MNDIRNALHEIGLTPGESQVYLLLLELGASTSGTLIKRAELASSKVYDVLLRLQKKGLANYAMKNGIKQYDATPPERLIDFLEAKKFDIETSQQTIKKILPTLHATRQKAQSENNTVVYTGPQGPKIVLEETIEAGRRGEKLMGFGTDEDPYKDFLPADLEKHFRDQVKYNICWYLLFTKGTWKSPTPRAKIKFLPKGLQLPVRTMIYGDKVAIVDFHKPFTTIIIHKKEIAKAYTDQFELLWKLAKE